MKYSLLIPLMVGVSIGLGVIACRSMGWAIDKRDLSICAAIIVFAGFVGLLPPFFVAKSDKGTVSQFGLLGTVIQMFLAIGLAAIAWLSHLIHQPNSFLYWLLGLYWASLVAVGVTIVMMIKQAPIRTSTSAAAQ